MKKYRIKLWHILLVVLFSALLPACVLAMVGRSKPPVLHSSQHTTQGAFWDNIRLKPVKVTEIEGAKVYWTFQDTNVITLGSFDTEERTIYPKNFQVGKKYLVVYCEEHKIAYEFQEWPP